MPSRFPKTTTEALCDLIRHMWIHEGYAQNGYMQMTTEEKILYDRITGRPSAPHWHTNECFTPIPETEGDGEYLCCGKVAGQVYPR